VARRSCGLRPQRRRLFGRLLLGRDAEDQVGDLLAADGLSHQRAQQPPGLFQPRERVDRSDVGPVDAFARLEKAKGLLRTLVAQAISRKKVPDLVFRVARPE